MIVDARLTVVRLNMVNHDPLRITLGAAEQRERKSIPVRCATEADVDRLLDLVMDQLRLYHQLDPAFYAELPNKQEERRQMLAILHSEGSICLTSEDEANGQGLLISGLIQRIPVYDPGGPIYFINRLVSSPESWETVGQTLVIEAMRMMVERGAAMINLFASPGEPARTHMLHAVGLSVVTEFFQDDLSLVPS
jgi:hypothetical protein